jgi:hypothetical protein
MGWVPGACRRLFRQRSHGNIRKSNPSQSCHGIHRPPPGHPGAPCCIPAFTKNLAGKRIIRWNQSSKARGNGIVGNGEKDRPPLFVARVACLFMSINNLIFCIYLINGALHGGGIFSRKCYGRKRIGRMDVEIKGLVSIFFVLMLGRFDR